MRKKSIVAAALLCILIIGITSLYLAGCSNTAKETAVLEEAGTAVSGNAVSENTDDRAGTDTDSDTVKGTEAETGNGETEAQEETVTEPFAEKVRVKGIYVTGAMAGTSNMDNLIALVDRTELNTMVIDVKNDEGRVVYDMDSAFVREIGAVKEYVSDMPGLIRKCKEHGIYLIARIVAFKDPFLAENRQDLALTDKNGNIFRDKSGLAWVNPYKREVWDYLLEIARQAASVGFDEIQFDYIRFSTDAGMSKVDFGEDALEQDKEDVITEFTIYAAQELHDMGVPLSADVYGVIIDSKLDASIVGQNYYEMAKHLDYISPMVYPSHYGPGNLGLAVPDAQPYETIFRSMKTSRKVLAGMGREAEDMQVSGNDVSGNSISGNGISGNSISENSASGNSMDAADPKELVPNQEIPPWYRDPH